MTDRELLERASRAAGLGPLMNEPYGLGGTRYYYREDDYPSGTDWNPLANDADAFRLAVKVKLDVKQIHDRNCVEAGCYRKIAWQSEKRGVDPYAATRRAIVRAAAALAKED